MKLRTLIVLVCTLGSSLWAQYVPTPDMAMSWDQQGTDIRKWVPQYQRGDWHRLIVEMVPVGSDIEHWRELLINQVDFTTTPMREYMDGWKATLRRADPDIKITEKILEDGSYLMTFLSVIPSRDSGELCVRKFIKGSDGIYQIAYSIRPSLKKDDSWNVWSDIIAKAKLISNPQKGR